MKAEILVTPGVCNGIEFQSPCGEEVMKGVEFLVGAIDTQTGFQSPCGEEVMKVVATSVFVVFAPAFQSPCGEEVMKVPL